MINFPKTGCSFARKVTKNLYRNQRSLGRKLMEKLGIFQPSVLDIRLIDINQKLHSGLKLQHGTVRQIPQAHKDKPLLSITRNPFTRYESIYFFKWWKEHPPAQRNVIYEQYPNFPDITISQCYEMYHHYGRKNRLKDIEPKIELGYHTIEFIQYYFKDPESVLRKIDDDYIDNELYKDDLRNITFLHQESLNSEITEFFLHIGIEPQDLQFIETMGKINVAEKKPAKSDRKQLSLGQDIRDKILTRDRLIFKIFPEYIPVNSTL